MISTNKNNLNKELQLLPLDYQHFVQEHLAQMVDYLEPMIGKNEDKTQFSCILTLDQKLNLVIYHKLDSAHAIYDFIDHNYVATVLISSTNKSKLNVTEWAKVILNKYLVKLRHNANLQKKLSFKQITALLKEDELDRCLMFTAKSYANYVVANLMPDLVFDTMYLKTNDYFAQLLLANWQDKPPFTSANIINQVADYLINMQHKHNVFYQELARKLHHTYEYSLLVASQNVDYNYRALIEVFNAYHLNSIQLPLGFLGNFITENFVTKNVVNEIDNYQIHFVFSEKSPADLGALLNGLIYFHNTVISNINDEQDISLFFENILNKLDCEIKSANLPSYLIKLKAAIKTEHKQQFSRYADVIDNLQLLVDFSRKKKDRM